MNIELIQGNFSRKDALEIITQMIHIKIKFHENKISHNTNEEDIKNREAKIKRLQKDLYDIRTFIEKSVGKINIDGQISLAN